MMLGVSACFSAAGRRHARCCPSIPTPGGCATRCGRAGWRGTRCGWCPPTPTRCGRLRAVWIDGGTRDEWYLDLGAVAFRDALAAIGVTDVRFELFDATHGGIGWRYPLALAYLAQRLSASRAEDLLHEGGDEAPRPGRRRGRAAMVVPTCSLTSPPIFVGPTASLTRTKSHPSVAVMVSLPGPRSPKRSIHKARSKLRGTRAGSSRSVSVTRAVRPHSPSISALHSSTGRSSSLAQRAHSARRTASSCSRWASSVGLAGRVSRQARRHHQVDPGLPHLVAGSGAGAGDDVGRPIRLPGWDGRHCGVAAFGVVSTAVSPSREPGWGHERHGVRRLPQPFVARLLCSDVHTVVDDGHGPPGNGAAPRGTAAFVGPTLAAPCSPDPLSSLNNRPTRPPCRRAGLVGRSEASRLVRRPQAWQVSGLPPLKRDHVPTGGGDVDGVAGPRPSHSAKARCRLPARRSGWVRLGEAARGRPAGRPRGG